MPPKNLRAEARLHGRKGEGNNRVEGKIPAAVRDHLGAREGDTLVFELGNTHVADRAAVPGPYFVVTLRRAAPTAAEPSREAQPAPDPRPPLTESLEETIRRLRNERQ
jgi:bifunctional DNA-binding transcriptional regulator/antitoxin component of YhaV-PrlF toxin-antitoxin module